MDDILRRLGTVETDLVRSRPTFRISRPMCPASRPSYLIWRPNPMSATQNFNHSMDDRHHPRCRIARLCPRKARSL